MSNLAKEYFNVDEAAEFCCVSNSQFRAKARDVGLTGGKLWGRIVYRRADLLRLIEQEIQWPQSDGGNGGSFLNHGQRARLRSSTGPRAAGSSERASGEYPHETPRSRAGRRKSKSDPAGDSPPPPSSGNLPDGT